jgi:hypothetical protein
MTPLRIALLVAFVGTSSFAGGCARQEEPAAPEASAGDAQPAAATEPDEAALAADAEDAEPKPAAARPKFIAPVKGTAEIGYLPPVTKVVKDEVVTTIKVKNLSKGSISLLRVDEFWFDKDRNNLPGDSQRWRKPFLPGEVIEFELRVPRNPRFHQNTFQFSHANGDIKATPLKSLDQ